MSQAAAAPREWWPALGHNAWKILVGLYAVIVLRQWFFPGMSLAVGAELAVMILLIAAQQRHDRSLCERCIAHWPLNPEVEVKKRRRWLRGLHSMEPLFATRTRTRITVTLLLAVVVAAAFLPDIAYRWWAVFVYAAMGLLMVTTQIHKRLEPWCPQCRGGGGGHFSADPVTPPSVRADR